ncbi:MAG: helix-turn-helix domain-containing protein, partial [Planctomycetes bacterium]|nr:helix-turn-helix domain-containing protein [Planctomycetota bacterium]
SSPGWKTALREELAPIVLEFYNEGWTQRAIARELGLPPATINLWLKSRQIR